MKKKASEAGLAEMAESSKWNKLLNDVKKRIVEEMLMKARREVSENWKREEEANLYYISMSNSSVEEINESNRESCLSTMTMYQKRSLQYKYVNIENLMSINLLRKLKWNIFEISDEMTQIKYTLPLDCSAIETPEKLTEGWEKLIDAIIFCDMKLPLEKLEEISCENLEEALLKLSGYDWYSLYSATKYLSWWLAVM